MMMLSRAHVAPAAPRARARRPSGPGRPHARGPRRTCPRAASASPQAEAEAEAEAPAAGGSRRAALAGALGAAWLAAPGRGRGASSLAAVPECKDVQIEDLVVGKGASPTVGVQITIAYVGKAVEKGIVIDSTYKGVNNDVLEPYDFRFGVGKLIAGVEYGISGMKVGGKRRITIPAGDCGLQTSLRAAPGRPAISKDSTLEYVVELLTIAGEYDAAELGGAGGAGAGAGDDGSAAQRRDAKSLFQDDSVTDPEFQF